MLYIGLKRINLLMLVIVLLLSGCTEVKKAYDIDWKLSPTFNVDNLTFHGTEGKFGMVKANGESDEPEFPVGEGRLYHVYFLDSAKDINDEKYKLVATHKDTGKTVELYELVIENKLSGAKFFLDKTGLWKIDVVSVDDEQYTSFIIEAK